MRFRRIRDKHGDLKPSANALRYNPGRGIYRSSTANALRLAKTEINRAYRLAEWERWQKLPFVIGFQIIPTNRKHTTCEDCEELQGIYPKDFQFEGWHPACLCICVPVMVSQVDFIKMQKAILQGKKPPVPKQPPMPKQYIEWVERQKAA